MFKLIFLISFSITSYTVLASDQASTFFNMNYSDWISSTEIVRANNLYINNTESIADPANTWQLLLQIRRLVDSSFAEIDQCVFYKIPDIHGGLGVLKVVNRAKNRKCGESIYSDSSNKIDGVKSLKVFLVHEKKKTIAAEPFILTIDMTYLQKNKETGKIASKVMKFPLYNLTAHRFPTAYGKILQKESVAKIYNSSVPQSLISGVQVLPLAKERGKKVYKFSRSINGLFTDRYSDRTAKRCHHVDKNCNTLEKYSCDRCRWGWFETVGSECSMGGTKFCGVDRCGEKGEPACLRGNYLGSVNKHIQCKDKSLYGHCQEGLQARCDGDGVLVCL